MASDILNEIISGHMKWNDFVTWISGDSKSVQVPDKNTVCTQGEFVIYFINLLRDDARRILQKSAKKTSGSGSCKESLTGQVRVEVFSPRNKNENVSVISPKHEKEARSISSECDANKNCSNKSILGKSVGSYIQNSSLDFSVRERSFSGQNSRKSKVTNARSGTDNRNQFFTGAEPSSEEISLPNCPLSPITIDTSSYRNSKIGNNEIDSPNNRVELGDSRKLSSKKKRSSYGRTTSSPCNASFSISEHNFPTLGSNSRTNSSHRRIKPTRLSDTYEKGSRSSNSVYSFGDVIRSSETPIPFREESCFEVDNENSVMDIREMLRMEKLKLEHSSLTVTSSAKSASIFSHVVASRDSVQNADLLLVLAKIYNILLNINLICNVIRELHFMLSLLIAQENESIDSKAKYFKSVHECVYFATTILNMQRELLKYLDKSSLKSLAYNSRIQSFLPELQEYILNVFERKNTEKDDVYSSVVAFPGTVCFQQDTDSRENFPTESAFCIFRKQRDAFYDILKVWEEKHTVQDWNFKACLGSQIHNLLNMNNEPANFVHFARLFRSQLLGSCQKNSKYSEIELDEGTLEILKKLKDTNPDKYSRLYNRLVAPLKSSNPSAVPEFPGQQEFYRDFIRYAGHAVFNHHLVESFWNEILNLNTSNFSASEVEEGSSVDDDTRLSFVSCIRNLQLLAKFLGYVMFLPYETQSKISEPLALAHSSLRFPLQPKVDISPFIQEALRNKRITLTIPWIVQYLAMMDCVSLYLPYYKNIMKQLFSLYRYLPSCKNVSKCAKTLLRICLGWLFELPQFPADIFYTWFINEDKTDAEISWCKESIKECSGVDTLNLVNYECMYVLCPPLETVKCFLLSDVSTTNVGSVRHITPLSVNIDPPVLSTVHHIEVKLEQHFLENQPNSVRRTIEFVCERTSSTCVKYICGKPLQETKEKLLKTLKQTLSQENKENTHSRLQSEVMNFCQELKTLFSQIVPDFCENKCSALIPLLLPEDMAKHVIQICVDIAVRNSIEKVNLWINSHITQSTFFKDINSEIQKWNVECTYSRKPVDVLYGWRTIQEKDGTLSPASSIEILRALTWKVMSKKEVSINEITTTLNIVLNTICHRKDLIYSAQHILGSLSVDLSLLLVTYKPETMSEKVLNSFLDIWKTSEVKTSKCFNNIMCSRNIMLLSHSSYTPTTWSATARLLLLLIENNIVSASEIETQCTSLLQEAWPSDLLKQISSCFEEFIKLYQSQYHSNDDFVLLMELLSELCREMDDLDSF